MWLNKASTIHKSCDQVSMPYYIPIRIWPVDADINLTRKRSAVHSYRILPCFLSGQHFGMESVGGNCNPHCWKWSEKPCLTSLSLSMPEGYYQICKQQVVFFFLQLWQKINHCALLHWSHNHQTCLYYIWCMIIKPSFITIKCCSIT